MQPQGDTGHDWIKSTELWTRIMSDMRSNLYMLLDG
jgi:hypothetical protein